MIAADAPAPRRCHHASLLVTVSSLTLVLWVAISGDSTTAPQNLRPATAPPTKLWLFTDDAPEEAPEGDVQFGINFDTAAFKQNLLDTLGLGAQHA